MRQGQDGSKPLYRQVAEALRAEIEGRLRPGEAIPTESELERRFGVSRITVRRALDELAQAGLVTRRRGSGTFVTRPKVTEQLGVLHSWAEGMRAQGLEPRTVDCEILRIAPPAWVAQALRLDIDTSPTVLRVQRLRHAGDEPLCLMVDYLPRHIAPDLTERGLEGESLYETLERRYGLIPGRIEDTVSARGASMFEAPLLGVAPAAPVLYVTRLTYGADDEPVIAASVVSRADRYAYRVSGRARRPTTPINDRQHP